MSRPWSPASCAGGGPSARVTVTGSLSRRASASPSPPWGWRSLRGWPRRWPTASTSGLSGRTERPASGSTPRAPFRLCRGLPTGQDPQEVADGPVTVGNVRQGQVLLHVGPVPTAPALLHDVAGLGQIAHDPVGAALGDADCGGD